MLSTTRPVLFVASAIALMALGACGPSGAPANIEDPDTTGAYQAQYRAPGTPPDGPATLHSARMNAESCRPPLGAMGAKAGGVVPPELLQEVLSRGDLVELQVEGDEEFTGSYVVSRDGHLKLPFVAPIPAQGRTPDDVARDIRDALRNGGFFNDGPRVSLLITDYAPVRVAVTGAVFEPRPVDIGGVPGDQVDGRRQAARGASTEGRNLTVALRQAGGVRPDADLSAVELRREGRSYLLDLRPVIQGRGFEDVMLATGDEILVPSRGCFQDHLMVPSPISPPGITLFLSNLTQPATGNAPSAIGREARQVPYGTRLMQGVANANCIGGARATSADRSAALFSRNPITDVSVVIERRIEEMRQRADRDDFDPYLLPGDALACYDSAVTNIGDVGRVMGLVGAGLLLR
ncbi:polysaccharide biosynthesis/export family protein [Rhodovulum adriaticum]|uniref:Protein involved in polysaccharide export with SLBB domain n=1 Tax=Rhodovulum adriaticum TaxID=35804 RepID=A0A4R2P0P3_RHOAD|nr:polysaccharide biosynthesis/export family protein [Rhodovulum adriaticum]MBK1634798.1 polysaccharide biosynthesis protein [Rhodovulum adriaticum]TCP27628.1 protein involved in polysaccharide export with SLBB domain [Rhodovulum adriaticum]